jgi:hypothetical protein
MAGRYGSKDVVVTYDDSPGGSPQTVTNFIMNLGGTKIVVDTESSEAFGDAWKEFVANGMRSCPDIPVSGFWDTTATTGPHTVFRIVDGDADPNGATRSLSITYGDSKSFAVETRLVEYEITGNNGKLTGFSAVLRPTGAVTLSA